MANSRAAELHQARKAGRHLLWSIGIFSFFVNLLMLTGPLFMLQVYDRVLGSGSQETLVALFMLVALLFLLMGGFDYARGRIMARYGARFQDALDGRVFDAVMVQRRMPARPGTHPASPRDLDAVQGLMSSPALFALFDIPWTPIFLAAIFIFHPLLGWLAVVGGAILIAVTLLNQFFTKTRLNQATGISEAANQQSQEYFADADLITAQGMGEATRARWEMQREEGLRQNLAAADVSGLFTAFSKAARLFLQSAMLAVGAYLVLRQELTPGAMIAASILLGRALAPIELAIGQWPLVVRARAGWASLKELFNSVPESPEKLALPIPNASLSLAGVSIISPVNRKPVLRNVSFNLNPGEALGVLGKSGAGKTTLARAMLGLVPLAAGEIRLDGTLIGNFTPDFFGRHTGYLPQSVTLFKGTVGENIARMSLSPDSNAVVTAAKKANAHELIQQLPQGYDTPVNSAEGYLSGGQKQRIGLARALYGDPVFLVLDEPNAALDHEGTQALNKAVKAMKEENKIVVIMTHRPMAIAECDKLIYIEDGQPKAYGPRDEVLKNILQNSQNVTQTLAQKAGT